MITPGFVGERGHGRNNFFSLRFHTRFRRGARSSWNRHVAIFVRSRSGTPDRNIPRAPSTHPPSTRWCVAWTEGAWTEGMLRTSRGRRTPAELPRRAGDLVGQVCRLSSVSVCRLSLFLDTWEIFSLTRGRKTTWGVFSSTHTSMYEDVHRWARCASARDEQAHVVL